MLQMIIKQSYTCCPLHVAISADVVSEEAMMRGNWQEKNSFAIFSSDDLSRAATSGTNSNRI